MNHMMHWKTYLAFATGSLLLLSLPVVCGGSAEYRPANRRKCLWAAARSIFQSRSGEFGRYSRRSFFHARAASSGDIPPPFAGLRMGQPRKFAGPYRPRCPASLGAIASARSGFGDAASLRRQFVSGEFCLHLFRKCERRLRHPSGRPHSGPYLGSQDV